MRQLGNSTEFPPAPSWITPWAAEIRKLHEKSLTTKVASPFIAFGIVLMAALILELVWVKLLGLFFEAPFNALGNSLLTWGSVLIWVSALIATILLSIRAGRKARVMMTQELPAVIQRLLESDPARDLPRSHIAAGLLLAWVESYSRERKWSKTDTLANMGLYKGLITAVGLITGKREIDIDFEQILHQYRLDRSAAPIPLTTLTSRDGLESLAQKVLGPDRAATQTPRFCQVHSCPVILFTLPGDDRVVLLACDHTFDSQVMARDFECKQECAYSVGAQIGVANAIKLGAAVPLNPDRTIPLAFLANQGFPDHTRR